MHAFCLYRHTQTEEELTCFGELPLPSVPSGKHKRLFFFLVLADSNKKIVYRDHR